jgi:hypothetical protein
MAEYSYDFEGKENKISAENLKNGLYGKITGYGNSMLPILKSGQSVICEPVNEETVLEKKNIVLCKVKGHYYLHLIQAVKSGDRYLIGNNRGGINGTISKDNIFGKVVEILE